MGSVFAIAARDIKGYLSTPKAAAIFWFFLLFMGFFFQSFLYTLMEMEQKAPMTGGQAPDLDQLLRALFQNFHFILLLVIPAITMGCFAEEKRTGAFRLLQSAPISSSVTVMGKFLAVAGVMALVLLCSAAYPLFTVAYGTPDKGLILVSYLGIFLLMCSQLAFGLWVSSMTDNQFIAFLFTMFGMFLLLILNWIAPNVSGGGMAEEIVKYIASTTHLESFLKGMITVTDVAYFACFTALFLFFTNIVLDSRRWR
jgi:ABC-2 type transport system permease protein